MTPKGKKHYGEHSVRGGAEYQAVLAEYHERQEAAYGEMLRRDKARDRYVRAIEARWGNPPHEWEETDPPDGDDLLDALSGRDSDPVRVLAEWTCKKCGFTRAVVYDPASDWIGVRYDVDGLDTHHDFWCGLLGYILDPRPKMLEKAGQTTSQRADAFDEATRRVRQFAVQRRRE